MVAGSIITMTMTLAITVTLKIKIIVIIVIIIIIVVVATITTIIIIIITKITIFSNLIGSFRTLFFPNHFAESFIGHYPMTMHYWTAVIEQLNKHTRFLFCIHEPIIGL